MIALELADIRDCTAKLFLKEDFDSFELVEADFCTDIRVELDGHLSDPEKGQVYAGWSTVRPLAFSVIRGKKLPHSFRILLRLSEENTANTLKSMGLPYSAKDISGLLLNIRYEGGMLKLITGCSYTTFIPDRTLEKEWDRIVQRFLRHHEIPFQALT